MWMLVLDYPWGPSVITRVHIRWRREGPSQRGAVMTEAEVEVSKEGAASQGLWAPLETGQGEGHGFSPRAPEGTHLDCRTCDL